MFQTLRNAWKITDLRRKILYTLFIILIFRIGSVITLPYIDVETLQAATSAATKDGGLMSYLTLLSGGGFSNASIFALSITPYINASIIIQLLTVAIPPLERMSKDGEAGRKKLGQITRYTTVGLGLMLGVAYYFMVKNNYKALVPEAKTGFGLWFGAIVIILCFTAGSALMMWLGEQINEKGIGNGISILLFAGILSRIPSGATMLWRYFYEAGIKNLSSGGMKFVILVPVILVIFLLMIAFIVFITDAERRIPVQYAKRVVGRKMYGGQSTHIPLKLLSVGVLPLIFAYSFMAFPGTIFAMFGTSSGAYQWWQANMNQTSFWYMLVCALLIIAFSYFYTSITFNPQDIAKNIQQQGGHIPGIRTGSKTVEFLTRTSNRLTLFAALFLAILSTIPSVLTVWQQVQIPFGASSILIAVSVAIETVRQVESQLVMRNYKGFLG